MTKEKEIELVREYPEIFEDYGQKGTALVGIWCDDGWYDLVKKFCEQLYYLGYLSESYGIKIKIAQIKEKFGKLRIYTEVGYGNSSRGHRIIREIIDGCALRAETLSKNTCEITGGCGSLCKSLSNGRFKTLSYEATRENETYKDFHPISNSVSEYWNELDRNKK